MINPKETQERFDEIRPELEKGDLPALIIAAFIAFFPALLLIGALVWLVFFLFGGAG